MPVTSRDCVSPLAVKLTFVLAVAALVGVNLTVTSAVAPAPRSVKGLPESMLKGAGTEAVTMMVLVLVLRTMKVRVAEVSMVTAPKLTGPVGVTAISGWATALATGEHALSFPSLCTAVMETL
jgi:hypothetical protein